MKKYIKPEITCTVITGSALLANTGGPSANPNPPVVGSRYRNPLWEDDEDDWLEE